MNNVLVVVVGFFDVTKLALIGVLISFFLFEYPYFSADFWRTKIRRRIGLSAAAWGLVSCNGNSTYSYKMYIRTDIEYACIHVLFDVHVFMPIAFNIL